MSVEELVQQYGYAIILLGSLVEGQPVMLFGGFAAHRGHLELIPWVILAGAVGNFVCLQAWFLVGRRFGRPLVEKRPHWADRVEKVQGWLARYESLLIVAIRFVAGASGVGTLAIGMTQIDTARFTMLNALGALLWATSLAIAGYLLGHLLELVLSEVESVEKPLLIGLVLLTVAWIAYHHVKAHRRRKALAPAPSGVHDRGDD